MNKISGIIVLVVSIQLQAQTRFEVINGKIDFTSDAPLELIEANSDKAQGIIDPKTMQFAFIVSTSSFKGFNSELQRQHFNEKYLESDKYYQSSFSGTIEGEVDFKKDGVYNVKANGNLLIHGKKQTRVLPGTITIKDGKIEVDSEFKVLLADHNIAIPKVVNQKVATEIYVKLKFNLEQQDKK
jgi:hypothetical protein